MNRSLATVRYDLGLELWALTWCSLDSCIAFSSLEPVAHAGKYPIGMNYTLHVNRLSC